MFDEVYKAVNTVTKTLEKPKPRDGVDGVSVVSTQIEDGHLILTMSNGEIVDAGRVVGKDGEAPVVQTVDQEQIVSEVLRQIPKQQPIDHKKVINDIIANMPKADVPTTEQILETVKSGVEISYADLKDSPDIVELIKKYTSHLEGRNVLRGASSLGQLIDVDLSGLTQDAQGNYVLTSGGSGTVDVTYQTVSKNLDSYDALSSTTSLDGNTIVINYDTPGGTLTHTVVVTATTVTKTLSGATPAGIDLVKTVTLETNGDLAAVNPIIYS
jgi:hypothetical protein